MASSDETVVDLLFNTHAQKYSAYESLLPGLNEKLSTLSTAQSLYNGKIATRDNASTAHSLAVSERDSAGDHAALSAAQSLLSASQVSLTAATEAKELNPNDEETLLSYNAAVQAHADAQAAVDAALEAIEAAKAVKQVDVDAAKVILDDAEAEVQVARQALTEAEVVYDEENTKVNIAESDVKSVIAQISSLVNRPEDFHKEYKYQDGYDTTQKRESLNVSLSDSVENAYHPYVWAAVDHLELSSETAGLYEGLKGGEVSGVEVYVFLKFVYIFDENKRIVHRVQVDKLVGDEILMFTSMKKIRRDVHDDMWSENSEWTRLDNDELETLAEDPVDTFGVFSREHADEITTIFNVEVKETVNEETGALQITSHRIEGKSFIKEKFESEEKGVYDLAIFRTKKYQIMDIDDKDSSLSSFRVSSDFKNAFLAGESADSLTALGAPLWVAQIPVEQRARYLLTNELYVFVTNCGVVIDGNFSVDSYGAATLVGDLTIIGDIDADVSRTISDEIRGSYESLRQAMELVSTIGNVADLELKLKEINDEMPDLNKLSLDVDITELEETVKNLMHVKYLYSQILISLESRANATGMPQEEIDRINAAHEKIRFSVQELMILQRRVQLSSTINLRIEQAYYQRSYDIRITQFISRFTLLMTAMSLSYRDPDREQDPEHLAHRTKLQEIFNKLLVVKESNGESGELSWLPHEVVNGLIEEYEESMKRLKESKNTTVIVDSLRQSRQSLLVMTNGSASVGNSSGDKILDVTANRKDTVALSRETAVLASLISNAFGKA